MGAELRSRRRRQPADEPFPDVGGERKGPVEVNNVDGVGEFEVLEVVQRGVGAGSLGRNPAVLTTRRG
jgi:hypothetical protein